MDFFVYSRGAIERVAPHDVPHVVISITSASDDVAKIPTSTECLGILRLTFLDADEPTTATPGPLFGAPDARLIWDFVLVHRAQAERVIVHCDAGISRSPAVAAAISRVLVGDDADFFK